MGSVPLAVELGARSIDHLEATGPDGVAQLAASDVVAVMLPIAALYLARPMPPARALVDAGAAIALATDFNPGSAFCESLPVVWTLACTQLGLTPEEVLAASTVNAAHVLGLHDRGRVAAGLRADLVLIDAPDWRHVAYHLAGEIVHTVVREGRVAYVRA
jgi:imidazolonepropionase